MAEEPATRSGENWQDWSAEKLAESYINFQISETEAKVIEVQSSLRISHESKPAMASADVQTRIMDIYHFEHELAGWKEDKRILNRKDEVSENLVQIYSAFERERREGLEKIKEQKKV